MIITVYDYLTISSLGSAGFSAQYDFGLSFIINVGVGFFAALVGGGFLVYFVNERYRDGPYWKSIAMVMASFLVVSASLMILVSIVQAHYFTATIGKYGGLSVFLYDSTHLKDAMVWLIVVVLTQVTLQVNDKFGQDNWLNFLLGKYHLAKEETRIFMFVDLVSSTTIAERLGNENYHRFLKEYFSDITTPIVENRGEIYQYVGDEVIISWKLTDKDRNNDCLKCYFKIRNTIRELSDKYISTFGVVPELKAGVHFGKVIVGEIGIIKRELTFSGDVLNTTSRIQGKCNEHEVKILASDELLSILPNEGFFQQIPIGNVALRGRVGKVRISTLSTT